MLYGFTLGSLNFVYVAEDLLYGKLYKNNKLGSARAKALSVVISNQQPFLVC